MGLLGSAQHRGRAPLSGRGHRPAALRGDLGAPSSRRAWGGGGGDATSQGCTSPERSCRGAGDEAKDRPGPRGLPHADARLSPGDELHQRRAEHGRPDGRTFERPHHSPHRGGGDRRYKVRTQPRCLPLAGAGMDVGFGICPTMPCPVPSGEEQPSSRASSYCSSLGPHKGCPCRATATPNPFPPRPARPRGSRILPKASTEGHARIRGHSPSGSPCLAPSLALAFAVAGIACHGWCHLPWSVSLAVAIVVLPVQPLPCSEALPRVALPTWGSPRCRGVSVPHPAPALP